jgi:hypothetical protein
MEFSPFNEVVKLCLKGIQLEESGRAEESLSFFMQGYREASDDHENFFCGLFCIAATEIAV